MQARNNSELVTAVTLNKLGDCLQSLMRTILYRWPEGCSIGRMTDFDLETYNASSLDDLSIVQLEIMYETAQMVFSRHLSELIAERMNSWNNFVKTELSKGGGLLFKYIAKEDKEFMRVNLSKLGGDEFNPSKILEQQAEIWSQYWSPDGKAGNETKERCAKF